MFSTLAKSTLVLAAAASLAGIVPRQTSPAPPLRTLIVGGGPDRRNNQVAIESNVRYVYRLLPGNSATRVLFTDGDPKSRNVLYVGDDNRPHFRAPDVPRLDGASELIDVRTELRNLAASASQNPKTPVLLYFTGHGGPDDSGTYANNRYDLWNGEELSVKTLASTLRQFPAETPVALVMVECFSGAFANVLFEGGDPAGPLVDRNVCGFFASVPQRMAAGCTPNVNEADYHDFTGYFFAALSGSDRMGRPVPSADYDHDGKIGMNEAFAYALIHDDSIDTPVCTSDAFLRRFVPTPDREVFQARYPEVLRWATPAQRTALEAISEKLKLEGDDRLQQAFAAFLKINGQSEEDRDVYLIRYVRLAKSVVLAHTLAASSDEKLKRRYADLVREEGENPLHP